MWGEFQVSYFDEKELYNLKQQFVKNKEGYLLAKRIIDIIGASIGLFIFSPIIVLIVILIKIEDPQRPVIFKQIRYGEYPKKFEMYKFRSMYVDAEKQIDNITHLNEQEGPIFKIRHDPRITNIGRFLRRTSLDEIPQLINVLKGEMSLVGPRPALPREVKHYNHYQMRRLLVKPGLTCIWQISGRNSIGFNEWVDLDVNYIENRSLLLDMKIIIKTIPVLFGDENAS